ncbi:expressed unknown protein [Seminavis robusta]|uniref:Uncharacterized protein n=1 Tax=Seminavis robusta TaxID=568900 RepID=A0A9N8HNT1_9STRA|nr:expressed unknown protein [Seminavis robusta]|eukprot:Sro1022_g232390.1 n/a (335) ;mRNA; f:21919-22923
MPLAAPADPTDDDDATSDGDKASKVASPRRGQVGVQLQVETENGQSKTTVEECPVYVVGNLRDLGTQNKDVHEKVQVFDFEDFSMTDHETGNEISLREHMEQVKPRLEATDDDDQKDCCDDPDGTATTSPQQDDDDDDDNWDYVSSEDIREETLRGLHDVFLPIVRQVLVEQHDKYQFYKSGLKQYHQQDYRLKIKKYAKPSLRNASDQYANYLHNDAWIVAGDNNDVPPIAMINVWFVLNDTPPDNTLVFLETTASKTLQSHMLHATAAQIRNETVVYDESCRTWGSFYLFVAGQRNVSERVLLHGAMNVNNTNNSTGVVRRSVEMRYTVHET